MYILGFRRSWPYGLIQNIGNLALYKIHTYFSWTLLTVWALGLCEQREYPQPKSKKLFGLLDNTHMGQTWEKIRLIFSGANGPCPSSDSHQEPNSGSRSGLRKHATPRHKVEPMIDRSPSNVTWHPATWRFMAGVWRMLFLRVQNCIKATM